MTDDLELLALVRRTALAQENQLDHETAGVLAQAADALKAAQAENEQWKVDFKELLIERDSALARLAELSKQEPAIFVSERSLKDIQSAQDLGGGMGRYLPARKSTTERFIHALYAAAGASPQPVQPSQALGTCEWTLDDDESATWASSCGELWSFIDGGPKENRVTYCHHCGKLAAINAKESK